MQKEKYLKAIMKLENCLMKIGRNNVQKSFKFWAYEPKIPQKLTESLGVKDEDARKE